MQMQIQLLALGACDLFAADFNDGAEGRHKNLKIEPKRRI